MLEPFALLANRCADAAALPLAYEDLPAERTLDGRARVGIAVLGEIGGCVVGVWELSPSVSTDVEVDEFFVVLSGDATVRFADGTPDLLLRSGTVGHLSAGARTTWIVRETLRKIYIA